MKSWNPRIPQAGMDTQRSSNQTPEKMKGKRRNKYSVASATDFHIEKSGSRLPSMSRLLSNRYLTLSTVWTTHGWRLNVEMLMGGCRSFWDTCWSQRNLPEQQSLCVSILEDAKVPPAWVEGKGPPVLTTGWKSRTLVTPRSVPCQLGCQTVIFSLFPLLCLQVSPSLVFWQKTLQQSRLFWQCNVEFAQSLLPACLVWFSGHDPLSRTDC